MPHPATVEPICGRLHRANRLTRNPGPAGISLAPHPGSDPDAQPGRSAQSGAPMDIAELLAFSVKNNASDLHLSAGLPPMIRVDGDMRRINVPPLEHRTVHSLVYDIMNDKQRKDYEEFLETDFSFEIPGVARFRVNAFNQKRGAGGGVPHHPLQGAEPGGPEGPGDLQGHRQCPARSGAGDRAHRLRQVDHPGGDGGPPQRQRVRATSSPSRTRSSSSTPARSAWSTSARCTRIPWASARPCARPCARTRTSSWWARCATWRPSAWP